MATAFSCFCSGALAGVGQSLALHGAEVFLGDGLVCLDDPGPIFGDARLIRRGASAIEPFLLQKRRVGFGNV